MIKPLILPETSDTQPHPGRRMTEAQFVAWCDSKTWAEWVDGEVIVMSPVGYQHESIFVFLLRLLGDFAEIQELGEVLTEPYQIKLPDQNRRRSPDIFFVAANRQTIIQDNHVDGAPDLIVEIVSPDNPARDWRDKYLEYEKAGVREYWIVDPNSEKVEAYSLNRRKKYQVLKESEGIIRSKTLKGFYLKPAWLFQEKRPKTHAILRELGVR